MNPELDQQKSGLPLPQPMPENRPLFNAPAEGTHEQRVPTQNTMPVLQPQSPGSAVAAPPQPAAPALPPVSAPPQPVVAAAPKDDDEIDELWVSKAKAIVEQTKNDPFMQSKALSHVKADFLSARYNKHVKVSDE